LSSDDLPEVIKKGKPAVTSKNAMDIDLPSKDQDKIKAKPKKAIIPTSLDSDIEEVKEAKENSEDELGKL
jgi:hypothetical protein